MKLFTIEDCVLDGYPPAPFKSWQEFAESCIVQGEQKHVVLSGVVLRARWPRTPEDDPPAPYMTKPWGSL